MTELGAEGIVNSVVSYLSSHLGDKLSEVDARYSDQLTLKDVSEWRIDDPLSGKLPDELPIGWVVVPSVDITQWGKNYDGISADVVIWVLILDSDVESLRKRIYRTMLAIWETVRNGHFGSDEWQVVGTPNLNFSETLSTSGQLFADSRVEVTIVLRETAS